MLLPAIFYLFNIYIVFLTNSRTAVISIILITSALIFITLYENRKSGIRTFKIFTLFSLFFVVLFVITYNIEEYNYRVRLLFEKFTNRTTEFSAGRSTLWDKVLQDYNFFGNGIYSFDEKYGNPPHNVYFTILDNFGFIPFILFIFYLLYLSFFTMKSFFREITIVNIFSIFVLIGFAIVSITESIRLHYLFYLLLIVGGLSQYNTSRGNGNKQKYL